ncbi:MAG: tRNA 4-thiouridine(8) synthase ThiI [Zetaproteobacteria bacterium]|nr:MAG: tRNA 4-thiouridine(8) synthase ThiI [Zetaproteobacteria bacterium]
MDDTARILIHYGEIALKGRNRRWFERKLTDALQRLTGGRIEAGHHGRVVLRVEQIDAALLDHLALIPGVRNFAPVRCCPPELAAMQQLGRAMIVARYGDGLQGRPFRVSCHRADKRFPLTSPQVSREVGGFLKQQLGMRVDLDRPEIHLQIEIGSDTAWLMVEKRPGIGGLPVGCSGRGAVLFSGGIDSPVAAYAMMKRGMEVLLVHCYNSTLNRDLGKIRRLSRRLARYCGAIRLFLVDMERYQRHAIAVVPATYRMVLYKRQMIRTAEAIAATHGARALVTGDSLGQVASQTLHNIHAIYSASDLPLLSPLIAADKEEIVATARRIGTYEESIEEYCDICSYLIAKHPETRADPERVARLESQLPRDSIDCPTTEEVITWHPGAEP